ncbi:SAM-dependent methyltransferase [Longispora albida]|uniref:SAM-dependent methyltransferase n=1 Tax=Longispora albida TaxID=203523 RepID=UPI00037AFECF|nr:SAM-dependent methyltransferase [Longispora albida]
MINLQPIGHVTGGRAEAFDDNWGAERAVIRLAGFGPEALAGLEDFSHLEVVFYFHQVRPEKIERGARRPRNNPEWPLTGVFAQRGKNRPNQLGVSRCQLIAVDGTDIHVAGLDAIDGTPVLDIKPYLAEFAPQGGPVVQPDWATELMREYY